MFTLYSILHYFTFIIDKISCILSYSVIVSFVLKLKESNRFLRANLSVGIGGSLGGSDKGRAQTKPIYLYHCLNCLTQTTCDTA